MGSTHKIQNDVMVQGLVHRSSRSVGRIRCGGGGEGGSKGCHVIGGDCDNDAKLHPENLCLIKQQWKKQHGLPKWINET